MPMTEAEFSRFELRQGDVLLNEGQSLELVGRCAIYQGEHPEPCAIQNQLLRFRANDDTSPEFAAHVFRRCQHDGTFARIALQTTSVAHLGVTRFASLSLLWPRQKAEQQAIADALSDVDALLTALDALIAKKRAIKLATMQQLLTGKTRLPGFSGKWERKKLPELADIDPENLDTSTPLEFSFNYISLEQVDRGKLLGHSEEIFRSSPSRARRVLRKGDVLMSTVRPNLLGHLLFDGRLPSAVCSTGFAVLRAKACAAPGFLFAHLFGQSVQRQIDQVIGGSNYPGISSRDVKGLLIPCPPSTIEQHAIAALLSSLDTDISAVERRRDKMRWVKQGMMQQLLTGRVRLVASPEASVGA